MNTFSLYSVPDHAHDVRKVSVTFFWTHTVCILSHIIILQAIVFDGEAGAYTAIMEGKVLVL